MIKKIIKNKKGYTIIETMIAISLFIIIIMAGMGALLNANLLHQKSRDMRSILDNLSFVMEDMSRNLRTGRSFYCAVGNDTLANVNTTKSGEDCWGVAFENQDGSSSNPNDQWVYYISDDGKIFKSTAGPYNDTANYFQLTPDEVVIDAVSGFSILGAEPVSDGNDQQPFIMIRLVGLITYKNITTPFSLQTSVSQRLIDVGN